MRKNKMKKLLLPAMMFGLMIFTSIALAQKGVVDNVSSNSGRLKPAVGNMITLIVAYPSVNNLKKRNLRLKYPKSF